MLNNIKNEIKYGLFSKVYIFAIIICVAYICLTLFSNVWQLKSNYQLYQRTYSNYIKNGEDVNASLKKNYHIDQKQEAGNQIETIDNPLKYDYDNVVHSLYLTSSDYIPIQSLEGSTFALFTILFGIIGVYSISCEYRYKTVKLKASIYDWNKIIFSKMCSGFIAITGIILISLIISYFFGLIIRNVNVNSIEFSAFTVSPVINKSNLFIQFLFSISVSYLFYLIGVCLGAIFKNVWIPLVAILAYNLVIPNLGKYDLKNVISVLGHKIYNFQGSQTLYNPISVSTWASVIVILMIAFISVLLTFFVSKKVENL